MPATHVGEGRVAFDSRVEPVSAAPGIAEQFAEWIAAFERHAQAKWTQSCGSRVRKIV